MDEKIMAFLIAVKAYNYFVGWSDILIWFGEH